MSIVVLVLLTHGVGVDVYRGTYAAYACVGADVYHGTCAAYAWCWCRCLSWYFCWSRMVLVKMPIVVLVLVTHGVGEDVDRGTYAGHAWYW